MNGCHGYQTKVVFVISNILETPNLKFLEQTIHELVRGGIKKRCAEQKALIRKG